MKSYIPEELNGNQPIWMIGPQTDEFDVFGELGYQYKGWNIGSDIYFNVSMKNVKISNYYLPFCRYQNLRLEFVLSWYCAETTMRGVIGKCPIVAPFSSQDISITGIVPGDRISGSLELSLDLVVSHPDISGYAKKNLKLWSSFASVIIEGYMAQFPIQIISFKKQQEFKKYKNSFFRLARDLRSVELTDMFYNIYVLYLNSDSPYVGVVKQQRCYRSK